MSMLSGTSWALKQEQFSLKLKFLPIIKTMKELDCKRLFTDPPSAAVFGDSYIRSTFPLTWLDKIEGKLMDGSYSTVGEVQNEVEHLFVSVLSYFEAGSELYEEMNNLRLYYETTFHANRKRPAYTVTGPDEKRLRDLEEEIRALKQHMSYLLPDDGGAAAKEEKVREEVPKKPPRKLSISEMQKLGSEITCLPPDRLYELVEMIRVANPSKISRVGDEFEVDIQSLPTETLRELQKFVRSVRGKKKKGEEAK